DAHDTPSLLDQSGHLSAHLQGEGRIARGLVDEEVEEVPLRHHRDEAAAGRQVGEVGDPYDGIADLRGEAAQLLVRQRQELVQETELSHELEGGGMDGIAAKVSEEVRVLFHD